jgi:hypothetical protein
MVLTPAILYGLVSLALVATAPKFGLERPRLIQMFYVLLFAILGCLLARKLSGGFALAALTPLICGVLALPIREPKRFKRRKLLVAWFKILPFGFTCFAVGYDLGAHLPFTVYQYALMAAVLLVESIVAFKFHEGYNSFAKEFAKSIYQDFNALDLRKTEGA